MVKKRGPVWKHWIEISNGSESNGKSNTHPSVKYKYCSKLYDRAVPKRMQKHLNKCSQAPNVAKKSKQSSTTFINKESSSNTTQTSIVNEEIIQADCNGSCKELGNYDYRCIRCKTERDCINYEERFQTNIRNYSCLSCISKRFQKEFNNWTSGNESIDRLIKEIQLEGQLLEWIPYNRFTDVRCIDNSDNLSFATWMDGIIQNWDQESNNWKRYGPRKVVLLNNVILFDNINEDSLKKVCKINKKFKMIIYIIIIIYIIKL